jgi:hypothetical protein
MGWDGIGWDRSVMDRSERAVCVSCLLDENLSSVLFNVEAFLLRDRYHSEGEGEGEG